MESETLSSQNGKGIDFPKHLIRKICDIHTKHIGNPLLPPFSWVWLSNTTINGVRTVWIVCPFKEENGKLLQWDLEGKQTKRKKDPFHTRRCPYIVVSHCWFKKSQARKAQWNNLLRRDTVMKTKVEQLSCAEATTKMGQVWGFIWRL